MRISGGAWCGRKLKAPSGDAVRPTQDRVREAIFSMLMTVTPDSTFLDLYAGSGAVGFEALSRGAKSATWVEKEPRHVAVLKENLALLGSDKGEVFCLEVMRWVKGPGRGRAFDVIYADPPYQQAHEAGFGELMTALAEQQVVAKRGFFIAEMGERQKAETVQGWGILRDRTYGHTRVVLYRKEDVVLCTE
jgi:16S rRNA (guanine966-N2)-methyltransferase